jgi:beta-lactam-binding protein with PASTA domain
MGSTISLVLGSGIGETQFIVPSLVGMSYCEARLLLQANGLNFGSVVALGISDTCKAYIYRQAPERYDEDKKPRYIRSGQLMDVWLQEDKPEPPPVSTDPATAPGQ